jgi:hypothetical protein
LVNLEKRDIETLLEISLDQEPDETPHSWCLDWTLRAEEYLEGLGYTLRETRYLNQYNLRARQGPHLWVELSSGEIIDGTVSQFCRDDLWILPPGHLARALYLYAGNEGQAVGSALEGKGHPLVTNLDAVRSMPRSSGSKL